MRQTLFRKFDNWLFRLLPGRCLLCGNASERPKDLCRPCEAELPWIGSACQRCALPLAKTNHTMTCGACLNHPPPQAAARAVFTYEFPAGELIQAFKFHDHRAAGRILGELFAQYWQDNPADVDAILPVPLHATRQRERGFNQAEWLARYAAKCTGLPVLTKSVVRTRATAVQSGMDARSRRKNMRGAFAVLDTNLPPRIAIIDDVMTTGSTTAELAQLLLKNGVERVEIRVLARTP